MAAASAFSSVSEAPPSVSGEAVTSPPVRAPSSCLLDPSGDPEESEESAESDEVEFPPPLASFAGVDADSSPEAMPLSPIGSDDGALPTPFSLRLPATAAPLLPASAGAMAAERSRSRPSTSRKVDRSVRGWTRGPAGVGWVRAGRIGCRFGRIGAI